LLKFAAEPSNALELRLSALELASQVLGPDDDALPLLERLLKDVNPLIRAHAVRALGATAGWTPSKPAHIERVARLADLLWRAEKDSRVRLALLRTASVRKLTAIAGDRQVYSDASMGDGWVRLVWASAERARGVRVRDLVLRDRRSKQVVGVLRKKGEGPDVDDQEMLYERIQLEHVAEGSRVDLVLEGSVESATHDPTPFLHALGEQTVTPKLLGIEKVEAKRWWKVEPAIDSVPAAMATVPSLADPPASPPSATPVSEPSRTRWLGLAFPAVLALAWTVRCLLKRSL
jgi:hypothetical protein